MSWTRNTRVALGLCASLQAGCSARPVGTDADSTGGDSSSEGVESSSSTDAVEESSSSSPGPDLLPDSCPERTLEEPTTLSVVMVDPDRDGVEPLPEWGMHTWLCTATALLAGPSPETTSLELGCTESITGETWRHELYFGTEWPLALADTLIGQQNLRLEYFAIWGSLGPVQYSLRNADGELLIWASSYARFCDPRFQDEVECDLARSGVDDLVGQPEPFGAVVLVDESCGLRETWPGDFLPPDYPGADDPEVAQRCAIQFDDDEATLVHDGRSARLTKAGQTFDAYVASAHVADTDQGSHSNASVMLIRVP